jgi:hypothetical protein
MTLRLGPLALLPLALCTLPATAQTVWRCPDGYRQQPCADGRAVNVGDERTPAQQSQAQAATRRDAKLAAEMQRERLQQEAQPVWAHLPASSPQAAKPATRKNAGQAKPFTATAPGGNKDKKKAAAGNKTLATK